MGLLSIFAAAFAVAGDQGRLRLLTLGLVALFAGTRVGPGARAATPAQVYSDGDPLAEEQYMLQLVNRARANPAAEAALYGIDLNEGLSPGTITTNAKPPLAFNLHLLASARGHSLWMLTNGVFSHYETNSFGTVLDPGDRMAAAGYIFSGASAGGENIAWDGTTGPPPSVAPTVESEEEDLFVDSSEPSRGHRLNILDATFLEIGIGVETGVFAQEGVDYNAVMTTQDFAESEASPGPFLVGVVYRDNDRTGFYGVGEGSAGVTVTPASGTYYAVTSTSGGYAIPLTDLSGTLLVTFSGGPLTVPITKLVTLAGVNVSLDFELNEDSAPVTFVNGSARFANQGQFGFGVQGPASATVIVQASPDLTTWTTIGQVTLVGGSGHFTDTPPSRTARRFYRVVGQ
jgi:uncharacterized protein YkwD